MLRGATCRYPGVVARSDGIDNNRQPLMRPIWSYPATTDSHGVLATAFATRQCPCCGSSERLSSREQGGQSDGRRYTEDTRATACDSCGWWLAFQETWDSSCGSLPDRAIHTVDAVGAALQRFSGLPPSIELEALRAEIEQHLRGKGDWSSWRAMESVTGSLLRSMGYGARVTAPSKDGGVDAVFDHDAHGPIFVQVKHKRNKLGVEVFRELIGTMVIGGANVGLLVTSSEFTSGVINEQQLAANAGRIVELVDGRRFLSALKLVERQDVPALEDILLVARPHVTIVLEERDI